MEIRGKRKDNIVVVDGDIAIVTDAKGKSFICDTEDWEKYKGYFWMIDCRGYVVTQSKDPNLAEKRFHRLVMKPDKDMVVDHINRDTRDNRKSNLRIVTQHENVLNSGMKNTNKSGYPGVHYMKNAHRWEAAITRNYHKYYLGLFEHKEDAIRARREAEIRFGGVKNDL